MASSFPRVTGRSVHPKSRLASAAERPNSLRSATRRWRLARLPRFDKIVLWIREWNGRKRKMAIGVGQTAPDFTLQNQDKKDVKLSDFAGKKNVVLVWYPLDWSPTCTNEHACFVNDMRSFDQLDAEVLGVSVDSTWSHKAYADKMGIKYALLADFHPKGAMSEKYGVYMADKGITGRAIAIVNKQGKVAWFKNYDIPVVPDLKEVASALGQVKAATA